MIRRASFPLLFLSALALAFSPIAWTKLNSARRSFDHREKQLNLNFRSAEDESTSWAASAATVLEYVTGHRMNQCRIRTLAALPYLDSAPNLNTCCFHDDKPEQEICNNSGIKNYAEMSNFLSKKLGIRNKLVEGSINFEELSKNIDDNKPVIVWLEKADKESTHIRVIVVSGYESHGDSLTFFDPVWAEGSLMHQIPYTYLLSTFQSGEYKDYSSYKYIFREYKWAATILLTDKPPVRTPNWVSGDDKPSLKNAIQVGVDGLQPVYICRMKDRDFFRIGKLIDGKCRTQFLTARDIYNRHKEEPSNGYEVLSGDASSTQWGPVSEEEAKPFTDNEGYVSLYSKRYNGVDSYINEALFGNSRTRLCRTFNDGEIFLGVVTYEGCSFRKEGKELSTDNYEALNFIRPYKTSLPTAVLETELRQYIDNAERKFREDTDKLTRVKVAQPDGSTLEGYEVNQVKQTFEQSKSWLSGQLGEREFSGMKAYVERFYPLANNLITFKVKAKQTSTVRITWGEDIRSYTGFYYAGALFHAQEEELTLATPPSVDMSIAYVIDFFARLRRNVKAVNLSVVSMPDEAGVELKTALGKTRTTSTNSQFTNVFRGLYTYTVRKNGYKPVQQELNLIDEAGTTLTCKLYSATARDGPYPCSLK